MFRWITRTRLRTGAILFFLGAVFISSAFVTLATWDSRGNPEIRRGVGAGGATSPDASQNENASSALGGNIPLLTAVISAFGTVSTAVLAWRADRRSAKESDLKVVQMQQQILELQAKLSTTPSLVFVPPAPDSHSWEKVE